MYESGGVGERDGVGRVTGYGQAAQGRERAVVDAAAVDDYLVRNMTEIPTSMCALYGKRATGNGAKRALKAAATAKGEAA